MIQSLTNVIVIILLSSLFVIAQKKQTDRGFDGLKGAVRSVVTERADLKKSSNKMVESTRKPQEAITYDSGGNRMTWKTYDYLTGMLFDSVVYSRLNGDKVAIYEDVKNSNKVVQLIASPNEKSSELSNARYSQTLKYKYDLEGKVTEEAWFQRDGALWLRYVYSVKGNQREELVFAKDGSLDQKNLSTLDENGNVIERVFYNVKKNTIEGKEKYEYEEFDMHVNWTKKLTFEGDEENKFTMKPREISYRTLIYF